MLHITNGESVTTTFRQVKFPGTYLAWNDVLHDGPVPQTESLSALSDVRARALAGFGAGTYEQLRSGFAARDRILEDFRKHEEVVLWFEHDLCDQLQLLQLLSWFAQQDLGSVKLCLIQIDSFPGVRPFHGLGQLSGPQLTRLFPMRKNVTRLHMDTAQNAWQTFQSNEPTALLECTRQSPAEMPFLAAALTRFCQEYPWTTDGLSRTERQILQAAATGRKKKTDIYLHSSKQEGCPWGDASIYLRMAALALGPNPALAEMQKNEYALTEHGRQLLDSKADWVQLRGGIDVWLGGVHLSGEQPQWRWDESKRTLVKSISADA